MRQRTYTYEARVIGRGGKRFSLESPRALESGDDVKHESGKYRVAYVYHNGNTYVILNPVRQRRAKTKAKRKR